MTKEDAQALLDVLRMQTVYTPPEIDPRQLAEALAQLLAEQHALTLTNRAHHAKDARRA